MSCVMKSAGAALMVLGFSAAMLPASAQQGLDEPFQKPFKEALAGKIVAYVPVAMNFDLTEESMAEGGLICGGNFVYHGCGHLHQIRRRSAVGRAVERRDAAQL